jgi:hypothetical protein
MPEEPARAAGESNPARYILLLATGPCALQTCTHFWKRGRCRTIVRREAESLASSAMTSQFALACAVSEELYELPTVKLAATDAPIWYLPAGMGRGLLRKRVVTRVLPGRTQSTGKLP